MMIQIPVVDIKALIGIILICCFFFGSCRQARDRDKSESTDFASTEIKSIGEIEIDNYNYYMDTEELLRTEHKGSKDSMNFYMQMLINQSVIDPPYINLSNGSVKILSYEEYKNYIEKHKLDSTKQLRLEY